MVSSTAVKIKLLYCRNCDKVFEPSRSWQKFCNSNCRKMNWFKRHKEYWNNYMVNWLHKKGLKKYTDSLIDFEPKDEDFKELKKFDKFRNDK